MAAAKMRKPRQQSWRGKTLLERVKLLEAEVNALNKLVIEQKEKIASLERHVEELEFHAQGCTCTQCTG